MTDLLPPNASPLERAIDGAVDARFDAFPRPIGTLWDPQTCAVEILPWLAWGLSIDRWDADWSEATKRFEVARAIPLQRKKGTRASVEAVLASFDDLLTMAEWFEQQPAAEPHTFSVTLPLDGAGGRRSTALFAEAIIRDVARAKPARSHFLLTQSLRAAGQIGVVAAARAVAAFREEGVGSINTSRPWTTFLQTEDGEPFEFETGGFIQEESA